MTRAYLEDESEGVLDTDGLNVTVLLPLRDLLLLLVSLTDTVSVTLSVAVGDIVMESEPDTESLSDSVAVGDTDADTEGVSERVELTDRVGEILPE